VDSSQPLLRVIKIRLEPIAIGMLLSFFFIVLPALLDSALCGLALRLPFTFLKGLGLVKLAALVPAFNVVV